MGNCNGRGKWLVFEQHCQCDDPWIYGGTYCEINLATPAGATWYSRWYLWTSLGLFVGLIGLGILSVRWHKHKAQQRSIRSIATTTEVPEILPEEVSNRLQSLK